MIPCEANRVVSETAYKASVPEDHKPKWESTNRRAFVSKKLRDSITDRILMACRDELCASKIASPFRSISGRLVDYCAVRYYVDDASASFRESVKVVFYGKIVNMYIIWLTRNFPTFDIFGCKRQIGDWTRYEIYISESEMADLIKAENKIRHEVGKFLDTFMSIKNENGKEKKNMGTAWKTFVVTDQDGKQTTGNVQEIRLNRNAPWGLTEIEIRGVIQDTGTADFQIDLAPEEIVRRMELILGKSKKNDIPANLQYERIIYSNGVTTILWKDKTKTTVRPAKGEIVSPGAGVAYAFMKKALGNGNAHNKILREEVPKAILREAQRIQKQENKYAKAEEKNGEIKNS